MKKLLFFALPVILLCVSINVNSQAVLLDGVNDFIDLGNDPSVQIQGTAITLEAWIFATEFKTNYWEGVIIGTDEAEVPTGGSDGYMLRCGGEGDIDFNIGEHGPGAWTECRTGGGTLVLNTWQHVAGVYDGTQMILYVDGTEVQTTTIEFEVGFGPTMPLLIGDSPQWRGRNFAGSVDEVRVWNVARSAAEIFEYKDKELCTQDQTGLVAYYRFSEGSGTTATDETGVNNGTFGGSTDSTDFHPVWIAEGAPVTPLSDCGITAIDISTGTSNLGQSFPNPASEIAEISYSLLDAGVVTIKLYNLFGKEVTTLVNEYLLDGEYKSSLNVSQLSSGIYFYQMHVNNQLIGSQKLIVQ